jgi:hypothetical protein
MPTVFSVGVFDKAEPSRLNALECKKWAHRLQPQMKQGIRPNCSSSRRTFPVVCSQLMTRERFTPWTPRAAVAAPQSSARCRRTGPVEWPPPPYGEASLRSLIHPTNVRLWRILAVEQSPKMAPVVSAVRSNATIRDRLIFGSSGAQG